MIWPLATAVALGLVLGRWVLPKRVSQSAWVRRLQLGLMVLMLVALGVRLAAQQATNPAWGRMFGRALGLAAGTIVGSVLFAWPSKGWLPAPEGGQAGIELPNPLRMLGVALGSLIAGTIAGSLWLKGLPEPTLADAAYACLVAMLGLIGVEGGGKDSVGSNLRSLSPKLLLVPVLIALGSVVGGSAAGFLMGFSPRDGAAIGAGCGWYSYTTIILGKLGGAELGSYALLANLFREALSLLVIPLLARGHRGVVLLAPAGCTAMDTTLQMLSRLGGERLGLMAFISGMICSLLVPGLVPFAFEHLPGR